MAVAKDPPLRTRLFEIAVAFTRLGVSSFGGPVAHLGYLRAELVGRRAWLDDAAFADLVALCQFLPGPASSQLVFALGMRRAGLGGALLASLCFTLPSAALMVAFALGVAHVDSVAQAGWLRGLKLAAVSVVALAVWEMGRKLCPDRARRLLALAAALLLWLSPSSLAQVGVIGAGALAGFALYRREAPVAPPVVGAPGAHRLAALALALWGALLVALPALASATGLRVLHVFDAFYRSGSLVFGGGHVILPLLRAEVVPPGWVGDDAFLAGYGAAQAVPGPLFTFAAYLGAAMAPGRAAVPMGLLCLVAVFLPAWLLIGGALPFWDTLRARRWAQAALMGANAVVVGVLLAALAHSVVPEAIHAVSDGAVAALGLLLLLRFKAPAWLVVAALAAAGQWLLPLLG